MHNSTSPFGQPPSVGFRTVLHLPSVVEVEHHFCLLRNLSFEDEQSRGVDEK